MSKKMNITGASITVNSMFGKQKALKYGIYLFTKPDNRDPKQYGWQRKNSEIIKGFLDRKDFSNIFTKYVKDVVNGKIGKNNMIFKSWDEVKKFDWTKLMKKAYDKASKVFKDTPHYVYFKPKGSKNSKKVSRREGNITGQLRDSLQGEAKKQ